MTQPEGPWERLRTRFDVVAMRPRLADGVRLRSIGDDAELVELSTKRVVPLSAEDAQLVRAFDGERSIAELIVAGIGAGTLRIEPVIRLVDRLLRAEMLAEYSTDLYRQIAAHLQRVPEAEAPQRARREDTTSWEAASQELSDRAAFLRGVSLLASLDNATLGALAEAAHTETWTAAHEILREGARSERFYIVRTGDVAVSRIETDAVKHRVARLGPG
ncbi:MAG: cyclic nucleotide-binding domain-containing protein, partial [Thermoleophilia bacterium]|nr:cyclic nucleotide-binding domain-containing protein [Thermoleophilia bacterium]